MNVLTTAPFTLAAGATVIAKIEAQNSVGYNTPSNPNVAGATVKKAPDTPNAVTTSYSGANDANVKILWSPPSDNSDPITSYTVAIKKSGTTTYPTITCTPTLDSGNYYCEVAMVDLTAATWGL